jgi:hypothetical protein
VGKGILLCPDFAAFPPNRAKSHILAESLKAQKQQFI